MNERRRPYRRGRTPRQTDHPPADASAIESAESNQYQEAPTHDGVTVEAE